MTEFLKKLSRISGLGVLSLATATSVHAQTPPQPTPTPVPKKWTSSAPNQNGLQFLFDVNSSAVYSRHYNSVNDQELDAFTRLQWAERPEPGPDGAWDDAGMRLKRQWEGLWEFIGGQGVPDIDTPLPFFNGTVNFTTTAKHWKKEGGGADYFANQIYRWQPEYGPDPFGDPMPGNDLLWLFVGYPGSVEDFTNLITQPSLHDSQRGYSWTFGAVHPENADPIPVMHEADFPQSTTVQVQVDSGDDANAKPLTGKAKINWYNAWAATSTGIQNTATLPLSASVLLPDNSSKYVSELHEQDAIMCWVRGEVGFQSDGQFHTIQARPIIIGDLRQPLPDERKESRVIIAIEHLSNGDVVLTLDAIPHIDPDFDENAPGYEELQEAREIDIAIQKTNHTGQALVKGTLELYVAGVQQVCFAPAEGLALEASIKALTSIGELAEKSLDARRAAQAWDETAIATRSSAGRLRTLVEDGRVTGATALRVEKKAADLDAQAAKMEHASEDAKSCADQFDAWITKGEDSVNRNGCFVAGTLVAMSDGTLKPIEQIKIGEKVLSEDVSNWKILPQLVLDTIVHNNVATIKLSFSDGSSIETTSEHPLYVREKGFIQASKIRVGDYLTTRSGKLLSVTDNKQTGSSKLVYNLTIDRLHNYFVGPSSILVHNVKCHSTWTSGFRNHIVMGNGPSWRPQWNKFIVEGKGVDGCHNAVNFESQYIVDRLTGQRIDLVRIKPGSRVNTAINGVYKIEYEIPKYDAAGNIMKDAAGNTLWKTPSDGGIKTLYDPSIMSDTSYMLRMTQARLDAAANGNLGKGANGLGWEGVDAFGDTWTGFDNPSGQLVTGFPN